jgi:hypothetical protein
MDEAYRQRRGPVLRPGQTCERPYQASITIGREPSDALAARVPTGCARTSGFTLRTGW